MLDSDSFVVPVLASGVEEFESDSTIFVVSLSAEGGVDISAKSVVGSGFSISAAVTSNSIPVEATVEVEMFSVSLGGPLILVAFVNKCPVIYDWLSHFHLTEIGRAHV